MPRRWAVLLSVLLLMFALTPACASADAPALRGYTEEEGYQYALFGRFPYDAAEDAPAQSVLWRVLGPGYPEPDDIINSDQAAKGDVPVGVRYDEDVPEEYADVFCLMTEYIIDAAQFNDVRDEVNGEALDYVDSAIARYVTTELTNRLLTPDEQSALVPMPGRGPGGSDALLSLPTRRGELHRTDYGFVEKDFLSRGWPRRRTDATPYAFMMGAVHVKGYSWYFTTDWRRYGFRWIAADNGHISVAGTDREGGIRPVCYVHAQLLDCLGGSGTIDDPYVLTVKAP